MTKEHALLLENAVVDGRTIYKAYPYKANPPDKEFLYSPDVEFRADCAKLAALDLPYRINTLAESDAQRVLEKYKQRLVEEYKEAHDPPNVTVVSYTKIEEKTSHQYNPFAVENFYFSYQ